MKKNVYVCITESLCCTAEINTTLQINYISIKKKSSTINPKALKQEAKGVYSRLGLGFNIITAKQK